MLGLMRRHSRSLLIKLLYIGIILSFVIWGVGSYQERSSNIAVKVNGDKITLQDYDRTFQNLYGYYREQFKDRFTDEIIASLNIQKKALDSLIEKILLVQEAKKLKVRVEEGEVSARIQSYPAFQNKGAFDKETYFQVLGYNKVKPRDFELEQEDLILMEKAEESIKKSATVSDEEILNEYKRDKTTVNLDFIRVTPSEAGKGLSVSEKEAKDHFAAHIGEFTIPEKVAIGYARLEPKDFVKEIKLTEDDFEDYYKSYLDDFTVPAKTRASHILVKFGEDKEKAREKTLALLEKARGGEDFAALAKKNSDDKGSAKKGGDLGFFGPGAMVKPFEDAVSALQKGEISDIVETVYGFHIIKAIDFTEESQKPLNDVRAEIRKVLESEISKELAQGRADDVYYEAIKGESLEKLLSEEKIDYRKTPLFSLNEISGELKDVEDAVKEAAKMDEGWISRPVEVENGFLILALVKKESPREPSFEEASDAVKKAVLKEKSIKAASEKAEKILGEIKKGASFKAAAAANKIGIEETGDFSQARNFIPKLGISEEVVSKAFTLTKEAPVADKTYRIGDDSVIVSLKERKEIDMADFEGRKDLLKAKMMEAQREKVFRKWVEDAKKSAELEYHEDLLNLKD